MAALTSVRRPRRGTEGGASRLLAFAAEAARSARRWAVGLAKVTPRADRVMDGDRLEGRDDAAEVVPAAGGAGAARGPGRGLALGTAPLPAESRLAERGVAVEVGAAAGAAPAGARRPERRGVKAAAGSAARVAEAAREPGRELAPASARFEASANGAVTSVCSVAAAPRAVAAAAEVLLAWRSERRGEAGSVGAGAAVGEEGRVRARECARARAESLSESGLGA